MLEQKIDRLNITIENLTAAIDTLTATLKNSDAPIAKKANNEASVSDDNVHQLETKTEKKEPLNAGKEPAAKKAEPDTGNTETTIDIESVREVLKNVSKISGRAATLDIMREYGNNATTMSQINADDYQAVYDAAKSVLQKKAA